MASQARVAFDPIRDEVAGFKSQVIARQGLGWKAWREMLSCVLLTTITNLCIHHLEIVFNVRTWVLDPCHGPGPVRVRKSKPVDAPMQSSYACKHHDSITVRKPVELSLHGGTKH